MTLRNFTLAIDRFVDRTIPEKHLQLQRAVALQILSGVVMKTPVDTGRARGNWQVTIGAPATSARLVADKAGAATISEGLGQLSGAQPFGVIHVGNNVAYIGKLEEGHSKQAPAGMLAITLAEVEAQFQ